MEQIAYPINTTEQHPLNPRDYRRVEQAIEYLEKNFQEHISPESLSVEVNLSVARLQMGFRQLTGYSIYKFHEQVKIRQAKNLLAATNKPLRLIASATGFKTQSHFGEVFKRLTGLTPLQYRNIYGC